MDLHEAQRIQADYDKEHWSHARGFETTRHSTLHLGKLLGKISTYCEAIEHDGDPSPQQLHQEVIPDLLIFAARLANNEGMDLTDAFTTRTEQLRQRFS